MAIRIGHMEITFAPRGILRTVWMKAFFHEVRPETVNIRNVKNQPPPADTSIAVFEVQNRIPAFCAERGEVLAFAAVDDLQSQNIFVEANGCPHVRNPKGNRRNLLNHRCASKGMPVRSAVVLTLSYFAPGDTNVFVGPRERARMNQSPRRRPHRSNVSTEDLCSGLLC